MSNHIQNPPSINATRWYCRNHETPILLTRSGVAPTQCALCNSKSHIIKSDR